MTTATVTMKSPRTAGTVAGAQNMENVRNQHSTFMPTEQVLLPAWTRTQMDQWLMETAIEFEDEERATRWEKES